MASADLHPFHLELIWVHGFSLLCEMPLPQCSYRSGLVFSIFPLLTRMARRPAAARSELLRLEELT